MDDETLEQAAEKLYPTIGWGHPDDLEQKCKQEGFIAGATWREQQAASGFTNYYYHSEIYKHHEDTARAAWIASALNSAKLLAEKDKLLEEQFALVSQIRMEKNTLEIQLNQAKELVEEMCDALSVAKFRLEEIAESDLIASNLRFMANHASKELVTKQNAEKIKTILGEE